MYPFHCMISIDKKLPKFGNMFPVDTFLRRYLEKILLKDHLLLVSLLCAVVI